MPSFIEHRKRSEQALVSVIQEAVVKGVSTRKIEAVLEEFGIAGVSAGQVSQLCSALDKKVRNFREGPLGEMRYVWVEALYEKVRVDDRVETGFIDLSIKRHKRIVSAGPSRISRADSTVWMPRGRACEIRADVHRRQLILHVIRTNKIPFIQSRL